MTRTPDTTHDKSHGNTTDGTVVAATGEKLTTTCGQGEKHEYTLAKNAKVTCDGEACKTADLKVGATVRVTTQTDDKTVATGVDCGTHIPAVVQKA